MDMAGVEYLNNDQLIDAVINDIRSAAEDDFVSSTTGPLKSVLLSENKQNEPGSSLNSSMHSESVSTDSRTSSTSSDNPTSYCLVSEGPSPLQITNL